MPSPLAENTCLVPSINVSVPFPQVKSKPPLAGTAELIFNATRPANRCTPPACPSKAASTTLSSTRTSTTRDLHIVSSPPRIGEPGLYSPARVSVRVLPWHDRAHFLPPRLAPLPTGEDIGPNQP